ncbi:hypothetical protein BDV11DRAFT_200884 [Aspergillus similis]
MVLFCHCTIPLHVTSGGWTNLLLSMALYLYIVICMADRFLSRVRSVIRQVFLWATVKE